MATFQHNTDLFSVSLRAENGIACLRLSGDVDGDCVPVLTRTAARLHRLAPQWVFVDLAEVSFAGADLVNFLVRVVSALPPGCATVLCRATPKTMRLLRITSTDSIAALSDHLPDFWLERHATAVLDAAPS